jgi:DNA polymerase-3 subunit delta
LGESVPASLKLTNLSHLYGYDLNFSELLTQAQTPSLMGGVQVFWISQADEIKKTDWMLFDSYCEKPEPQTYFIFEADELSDAHPLVKLVSHYGKHQNLKKQAGNGADLLRAKLRKHGKMLTPDAWEVLEERLGGSLKLMDLALDQLLIYSERSEINEEEVRGLTKEFLQYEPFDLTDALIRGDIPEALKIFHFFYELSGDVTQITGLIHWQLKRIWQAKKMLERGERRDQMAKTLRIPPFRMAEFMKQLDQFEMKRVEELLRLLWEFDWNTKKGAVEGETGMEVFLSQV